jgi:hypothetical protein
VEHPLGEPAHDLEPLGIHVQERDLVDRHAIRPAREPVDQLRRVGAAAADDRELQAHPHLVRPATRVTREPVADPARRLDKMLITLSALNRRARGPTPP